LQSIAEAGRLGGTSDRAPDVLKACGRSEQATAQSKKADVASSEAANLYFKPFTSPVNTAVYLFEIVARIL